jgi:hypothetical protein
MSTALIDIRALGPNSIWDTPDGWCSNRFLCNEGPLSVGWKTRLAPGAQSDRAILDARSSFDDARARPSSREPIDRRVIVNLAEPPFEWLIPMTESEGRAYRNRVIDSHSPPSSTTREAEQSIRQTDGLRKRGLPGQRVIRGCSPKVRSSIKAGRCRGGSRDGFHSRNVQSCRQGRACQEGVPS